MPGPQQACRELVASWAEARDSSATVFHPACLLWECQKPLDSRPAYTSRWPFRMGCGNSRGVSSGIFIHISSNTPRSWSTQYLGKKHNRETRYGAALALCSLQEAAVLLLTPRVVTKRRGSILTTFFLHPLENLEVDWMLLQRRNKGQMLQIPSSGYPSPAHKEVEKKAGSPYLVVWVWNGGRTLHFLTCNRGKEGSALVMVLLTYHDGLSQS